MSVPDNTCTPDKCTCKQPMVVQAIKDIFRENEEMLDKLESDENGVSYWEKYEERLKYMEENGI